MLTDTDSRWVRHGFQTVGVSCEPLPLVFSTFLDTLYITVCLEHSFYVNTTYEKFQYVFHSTCFQLHSYDYDSFLKV